MHVFSLLTGACLVVNGRARTFLKMKSISDSTQQNLHSVAMLLIVKVLSPTSRREQLFELPRFFMIGQGESEHPRVFMLTSPAELTRGLH